MLSARVVAAAAIPVTVIAVALVISLKRERAQTIYNPYPPGILPSNIASETQRVIREVNVIEAEAMAQWHALPPPTLTGNPPILQGTGAQAVEILGKLLKNYDITFASSIGRRLNASERLGDHPVDHHEPRGS